MGHAIFGISLRGRHLVVTTELKLTVDDVVERISTPGQRILCATARSATATPFIGENHLGAIVVEGGRMPISKTRINHLIQSLRIRRIRDIQQDAIAGASACCQANIWIGCNVVALIGLACSLSTITVVTTIPKTSQSAGIRVGEYKGAIHDLRGGWVIFWNFDNFDAEQCGFRILEG